MAKLAAERLALDPTSPWWGEHRCRYHFAAQYVAGRTVLDIACGTGFGGPILLRARAKQVIGMDIAWEGVSQAMRASPSGYQICQADGTRLPLRSGVIDVIASFETLEHISDHGRFLCELRRVLRPDGILILSTPNALHTRPIQGKPRNPFHVREFTPEELGEVTRERFSRVELLGQRTHPGYLVSPYWDLPDSLPRDIVTKLRVLGWKLQRRLPFRLKDSASRLCRGHGFYPGEHDFIFTSESLKTGHVLVAVCRP